MPEPIQSHTRLPVDAPSRAHVLVVEDEALAAMAIEDFLSRRGYRVTLAGDGMEGLARHRADPARIVVTDLRMPRMDGRRLIRELRAIDPHLPIIVMTGFLAIDIAEDELTDGTWRDLEVLRKPVSPQTIHDTLLRFGVGPE